MRKMPERDEASQSIRIEPPKGFISVSLRELWQYRDLLYFLVWRDIKVRYKQTGLGVAWAVLQPLLTMVVFSVFFGRLAKMPSDGVPYSLFTFAGLVPWIFFANGLTQSSNSLVSSSNLISKVYFPRLHVPLAAVLSGAVDFGLSCLMLGVMMALYHVRPSPYLWYLPLFALLAFVTMLGVGLWFSALNVRYRDVRYIVPFVSQFWMFATPIAYPSSLLSEPWRTVYSLNPLVGVVEGFRWAFFGTKVPGPILLVSTGITLIILVAGAYYFQRVEASFADVI
jgi:lipopolysaccharide transport system permease protein